MATLRKINGKYYAYFYDPHRKPKRKSVALRVGQKSAAEQLLRRKELEYAEGKFDPWNPQNIPSSTTLSDGLGAYLEHGRKSWRSSTFLTNETVLRQFERTLPVGIMVGHVDASHVEGFVLTDKSVKQATRRMRFVRLRAFFNWLKANHYVHNSPIDELKAPKRKKKVPKFLSREQLQHLLESMDAYCERARNQKKRVPSVQWLKDVILVAVSTGMRLGELCALRWEDVDFDNGFVTVRSREGDFEPKSGDERSIPVAGDAVGVLKRLSSDAADPKDYVLSSATGKPLNKAVVSQRFKFFAREAGLPDNVHFHSLRHTTASWLVQSGVSLPIVQAILGHSSVQVTQQYAHLAPDVLVQAMNHAFANKKPETK